MTSPLVLHELTLSPNNVKVRIALGYKGLPYERVPLAVEGFPGDRSTLVALSRQPRTPVLVHGDTVVFDSASILRYLDANFPDTPSIFTDDYQRMGEIEQWETWARTELATPIRQLFAQAFSPEPDAAACEEACALMHERTGRIESQLAKTPYLTGDTLTAADITAAPGVNLAMLTPAIAETSPVAGFFRERFRLGEGRERTAEWARKIVAHDEVFRA